MALKSRIGSIGFCGVYVNLAKNNHMHYMTEGKKKFERLLGGSQFFFYLYPLRITNESLAKTYTGFLKIVFSCVTKPEK